MNAPQKIITGIALLLMAYISFNFNPWGMASPARKVMDSVSDLLTVLFVWGALYILLSFIKGRRKRKKEGNE